MNGVNKFIYLLRQAKNILVSCDFLKENRTFYYSDLLEPEKTHLATALGLKACEQGYQVKFFRVADLVGILEEALKQGNLTRIKKTN
ncbi:ATP-binding protein [Bacillus cereus]